MNKFYNIFKHSNQSAYSLYRTYPAGVDKTFVKMKIADLIFDNLQPGLVTFSKKFQNDITTNIYNGVKLYGKRTK